MATMLFRGLKGVNLSCASPASTAVCSASDRRGPLAHLHSSISPLTSRGHGHGRPSQKQPQLVSPASSSRYLLDGDFDELFDVDLLPSMRIPSSTMEGSTSTADVTALELEKVPCDGHANYLRSAKAAAAEAHGGDAGTRWVRFHTVDGGESAALSKVFRVEDRERFAGGEGSSRRPVKVVKVGVEDGEKAPALFKSASATAADQVVVLRVSLHCKGCEGKVRKHLSRMPGVTSFNIDFPSKKVTVVGDVMPLEVLSSISKVKNAQFWPSPPPPVHSF